MLEAEDNTDNAPSTNPAKAHPLSDLTNTKGRTGPVPGTSSQLLKRRHNNDITPGSVPKSPKPSKQQQRALNARDLERITLLGAKFTHMGSIWLVKPSVAFTCTRDWKYDPLRRFDSDETQLKGQLEDLYTIVPDRFHEMFNSPLFQVTVCHLLLSTMSPLMAENFQFLDAMEEQRSTAPNRVRHQCGSVIFECPRVELKTIASRGDSKRFRKLAGWKSKDEGYETFAPILYQEGASSKGPNTIFRNKCLIGVCFLPLSQHNWPFQRF